MNFNEIFLFSFEIQIEVQVERCERSQRNNDKRVHMIVHVCLSISIH